MVQPKTRLFVAGLIVLFFMSSVNADDSYLKTPWVGKPSDYSLASRKFTGIPSMAISPNGRLWATWYAGKTPEEGPDNYVVVATSGDDGNIWVESHIIDLDSDGLVREFDPQLWIDPDGRLWSFWAQDLSGGSGITVRTHAGVWSMVADNPDIAEPNWSGPRRLTDGVMMGKPLVLSSGEWILPASKWFSDNSARVVVSLDHGKTWAVRGACNVLPASERLFDEHMIVERKDKSLWMLVRTKYGIGESVSNDRGKTWSAFAPSALEHPTARFFIRRLNSGSLLLVKHGPVNKKTERSHLTAYISKDDGKTWIGGLLLDERLGVSYPDGQQKPDGTIYIIYDYSRIEAREILMAKFNENDVIAGDPNSPTVSLRRIVSKPLEKKDKN
jgi:predicted neuraminidase